METIRGLVTLEQIDSPESIIRGFIMSSGIWSQVFQTLVQYSLQEPPFTCVSICAFTTWHYIHSIFVCSVETGTHTTALPTMELTIYPRPTLNLWQT